MPHRLTGEGVDDLLAEGRLADAGTAPNQDSAGIEALAGGVFAWVEEGRQVDLQRLVWCLNLEPSGEGKRRGPKGDVFVFRDSINIAAVLDNGEVDIALVYW